MAETGRGLVAHYSCAARCSLVARDENKALSLRSFGVVAGNHVKIIETGCPGAGSARIAEEADLAVQRDDESAVNVGFVDIGARYRTRVVDGYIAPLFFRNI